VNSAVFGSFIFELIHSETAYVKDLESLETVRLPSLPRIPLPDVIWKIFIGPLRTIEPPVIPPDRLKSFITDVFHNCGELYAHHRRLVERLHEIQREEHPVIRSITAALFDAAISFRDAYLDYIPNYPIGVYRINAELATNPVFKSFYEVCPFVGTSMSGVLIVLIAMCPSSRCPQARHENVHIQTHSSSSSVPRTSGGHFGGDAIPS
jgi:hypothetical protein